MRNKYFPYYFTLLVVIPLGGSFISCKRQSSKQELESDKSKAEIYLENMEAKEAANIRKGWRHVEGEGYTYSKPDGWTEHRDIEKGVYFELQSPDREVSITLVSRYIESIPNGVENLEDWARLQYKMLGMPEAIQFTKKVDVNEGRALDARILIQNEHLMVRYYMNIFDEPTHQRSWLLMAVAKNEDQLKSQEVKRFFDSIKIDNYKW